MTAHAWTLLAAFSAVLLLLAMPLGRYIATVMDGRLAFAARVETPLYRLCGVKPDAEMGWLPYTLALLLFNGIGLVAVYALQRLQLWLPLNPQGLANVSPDSALNTAISFATNTNWQGYGGETTMSYLTQMLGLGVQNFLSAATGIVVVVALVRGFARHGANGVGNAWVDLTRVTLWVLLPLSFVLAIALVSQGVVQTFDGSRPVQTLEVVKYQEPKLGADGQPLKDAEGNPAMEDKSTDTQTLPLGPAASQIATKQLGTNGGGFFNVNSAHPFENPTPLSN
ncbi:MAG: potassium-transporting ATPase subunit KdpA, partial [Caldimonas sp.]